MRGGFEIHLRAERRLVDLCIAKQLGCPYNTIKNEIKRGTVTLYNGKVQRYKADEGEKVYLEHRQNCRKQYRCLTMNWNARWIR